MSAETCDAELGTEQQLRYRRWLLGTLGQWHQEKLLSAQLLVVLVGRVHRELRDLQAPAAPEPVQVKHRTLPDPVRTEPRPAARPERAKSPRPASAGRSAMPAARELPAPQGDAQPRAAQAEEAPRAPKEKAPRAPAAQPFPLPAAPQASRGVGLQAVGGFLKARVGWVTGVGLTVVGSFFLAGTVWSRLSVGWRQLLIAAFLAVYALGFSQLGRRMGRVPGGAAARRWLLGVAAALVPVHAMAVGGLWEGADLLRGALILLALAAVGAFHWLLLRRDLPHLLPPHSAALRHVYLALSLAVGLLPLVSGPGWLLISGLLALAGLWCALTRWRRLPPVAGGLLLYALAFHLYLAPRGAVGGYGPLLALVALGLLYLDSALGRWRGLHGQGLKGLYGVLALGLAAVAVLVLIPGLAPLPTGPESALVGLLLCGFFLGAALDWRRPALIYGSAAAALLFTLALPHLFRAIVEPLAGLAGHALGYESEPLPLAWYSLTLLPYLLVCRLAEAGLARSGWRQREQLARGLYRWGLGLSALLLLAAHSRPDDLRPALLALPLHALFWLRERRVRGLLRGTLPWLLAALWMRALLHQYVSEPAWSLLVAAPFCVSLVPLGRWAAGRLNQAVLLQGARLVVPVAALLLPLSLGAHIIPWLGCAAIGIPLWIISLQMRPRQVVPTTALERVELALALCGQALTLLAGLLLGLEQNLSPLAWACCCVAAAGLFVGLAWLLPRRRREVRAQALGLHVWAHLLALAAVLCMLELESLPRAALKLPLALLLVHWMFLTRSWVYGGLLSLGLVEAVVRRMWVHGDFEAATLLTVAALLAWLSAAALALWRGASSQRGAHWLQRALGAPSAWLGTGFALPAAVLLLIPPWQGNEPLCASCALAAALLLGSRLFSRQAPILEAACGSFALACALSVAFGTPDLSARPVLLALPVGLALLAHYRPSPVRDGLAIASAASALLVALTQGPLASLDLLAACVLMISLRALRAGRAWAELALSGWVVLGLLALQRFVAPGADGLLLALMLAPAGLLLVARRTWIRRLEQASWRVGTGLALIAAGGWALRTALLADSASWQFAALWAALGLLLLFQQRLAARCLAPWAVSASVFGLACRSEAALSFFPAALLLFAWGGWLLGPRGRGQARYACLLAGLAGLELLVLGALQPETHLALAPLCLAFGLLLAHTGQSRLWAWGGLAAGLFCAALPATGSPLAAGGWALLFSALLAWTARPEGPPLHRAPFAALLLAACLCMPWIAAEPLRLQDWAAPLLALAASAGIWQLRRRGRSPALRRDLEQAALVALLALALAVLALPWIWAPSVSAQPLDGAPPALLLLPFVAAWAWNRGQRWLLLASLPLLAWLPGQLLDGSQAFAWPLCLALLALLCGALRSYLPGRAQAAWLCLLLGSATQLGALLPYEAPALALVAVVLAAGWLLIRQRAPALVQLFLAAEALACWGPGLGSGLPALVALLAGLWTASLGHRRLALASSLLALPLCVLNPAGVSGLQLAVLGLAVALSAWESWRKQRSERWYATLAWAGSFYLALRLLGPLQELPVSWELLLLVGLGLLLEWAAAQLAARRGQAGAAPLRHGAAAAALAGVGVAALMGGLSFSGLAAAGALFCLRHILRGGSRDLLAGVLLLDAAALIQLWPAGSLASWGPGLSSGLPALVALLIGLWAASRGQRWLGLASSLLALPLCVLNPAGVSSLQLSVLGLAVVLSAWESWRQPRAERWYQTLAWAGAFYLALRLVGPLQDLAPRLELPLLVGLGLVLESVAALLSKMRGQSFALPLRHGCAAVALVAVGAAVLLEGLSFFGLAAAGSLFCLRHVFRGGSRNLLVGALLLDAAALRLALQLGWEQPIAYVGPMGLSVLVVAQRLRRALDPRVVAGLRYAAAGAIYLTVMGQALPDPGWTLALLLLSLGGLAAGKLLRVAAFLYLGSGFAVAGMLMELLRFGLEHSQFWAFYLTLIGLSILSVMVLLTLYNQQLRVMRLRVRRAMADWE